MLLFIVLIECCVNGSNFDLSIFFCEDFPSFFLENDFEVSFILARSNFSLLDYVQCVPGIQWPPFFVGNHVVVPGTVYTARRIEPRGL
jgi:hypothetical protein